MTITVEKSLLENYISMFDGFSVPEKEEIRKRLGISAKTKKKTEEKAMSEKEELFYKSLGAWESDLSPEDQAAEIRAARKFREKDLSLD